jgi:tetratricopeptide (TPR) repeat protein
VAYQRFREAREAGQPEPELRRYVDVATDAFTDALRLFPADATPDLAILHNQFGVLYQDIGVYDAARHHYQLSARLKELAGDRYGAGLTRSNLSILLADSGQRSDALLYARAALADFESYAAGAATAEIELVRRIIDDLEAPDDPTTSGAT